jgi:hypothetical protein
MKGLGIVPMNDRLHGVDLRVTEKGEKGRANDRLAGNGPVLLGHLAASAMAPPSCDNDSRNPACHELTPLIIPASL